MSPQTLLSVWLTEESKLGIGRRKYVPCNFELQNVFQASFLPDYLFRDGFVLKLGRQVKDGFHRETLDILSRNVKEINDGGWAHNSV